MNIPVSGYLYGSDENEGTMHTHNLYITNWNGNNVHVHEFTGVTSSDLAHSHPFAGTTEPSSNGMQHTHRYSAFTAVADGHVHKIRGVTGPAIFLPNGRHYHEFQGVTTVDGLTPHTHRYRGRTSM